jgi:hypothetical protein
MCTFVDQTQILLCTGARQYLPACSLPAKQRRRNEAIMSSPLSDASLVYPRQPFRDQTPHTACATFCMQVTTRHGPDRGEDVQVPENRSACILIVAIAKDPVTGSMQNTGLFEVGAGTQGTESQIVNQSAKSNSYQLFPAKERPRGTKIGKFSPQELRDQFASFQRTCLA